MPPDWKPPRFDLVRNRTSAAVNRDIDALTTGKLAGIGGAPHAIRQRLWELDREWHVERALMAVFAVSHGFVALRALCAVKRGRWWSGWRLLLWLQLGDLMVQAIRGWCPPVGVLRRVGFRTEKEIAAERTALESRLATSHGL